MKKVKADQVLETANRFKLAFSEEDYEVCKTIKRQINKLIKQKKLTKHHLRSLRVYEDENGKKCMIDSMYYCFNKTRFVGYNLEGLNGLFDKLF